MKLTDKELKHLKTVIEFLYADESKHYESEGRSNDHIFVSVLGLQEIMWRGNPDLSAEETASRSNGEPAQPGADDYQAADGMRMQILYSVFERASLPDALKTFIDNAIKDNHPKLLMTAQVALDNYQGDQEIPF